MVDYIHGETSPGEIARLEKQARFAARWLLEGVDAGPGALVLDLPVGTGAMARRLRARLPDVRLAGAHVSRGQLAAARGFMMHPADAFPLVNANAAQLPFRDGTFDLINSNWFLEHLPRGIGVPVLREMRRVLAPRGCAWLCEVDNASLSFWPRLPLAERCFAALCEAQERAAGAPRSLAASSTGSCPRPASRTRRCFPPPCTHTLDPRQGCFADRWSSSPRSSSVPRRRCRRSCSRAPKRSPALRS